MFKGKLLFIMLFFMATGLIFAQNSNVTRAPKMLQQKEETVKLGNFPFYKNGLVPAPFMFSVPNGAIPGMVGFSDYASNGNTLQQIVNRGDTIVVAMVYLDSIEATNANGGTSVRIAYNYSFNRGLTWESTTRFDLTSIKSRWPDLVYLNTPAGSTIGSGGRIWNGSLRAGAMAIDVVLGAATGSVYYVPGTGQSGNTDYFTALMNNTSVAGVWQRNDTIYYQGFNTSSNTFGPRVFLYRTANSNTVASYDVYSSANGTTLASFYNFVNEDASGGDGGIPVFRYQKSTDAGATWSSPTKILGSGMIGGDSAQAYWHQDAAFKPTTQDPYLVFSTQPGTGYGNWEPGSEGLLDSSRKAYNVCIWSPNLNGGNPVRVASYLNVDVLSDTAKFKQVTRLRTIQGTLRFGYQVNASIVGHPSIGFSDDGSVIHVAFEVARPDTSAEGFNFFDIFTTMSSDGGTTWSTPLNVTNTTTEDEMYPSVSKTGNSNTGALVTYQSTPVPGCQGFGPNSTIESQIIAPVYQIFKSTIIGIQPISNEVPNGFVLKQNYPNPFNPSTTIRFAIPKASNVTIEVFDVTGRLVKTLANNELVTAGVKEISFDASNLSSGIYFYTMKTAEFTETKKMMLIK
jgi:hypothetical protein